MKFLLSILFLSLSSQALAVNLMQSISLYGDQAQESVKYKIAAQVSDNGVLEATLTKSTIDFSTYEVSEELVNISTTRLYRKEMMKLRRELYNLHDTPIAIESRRNVCTVLPAPGPNHETLAITRSYDTRIGRFLGELELIYNDAKCYDSVNIYPESTEAKQAMERIKNRIDEIALLIVRKYMG